MPVLTGIHHVKYPVSDLAISREWYERVLGYRVAFDFPDEHGVVKGVGGFVEGLAVPISLQENPAAAAGGRRPASTRCASRSPIGPRLTSGRPG
ncbi:VOC family protein [Fodinicola feengrottensis]|uniref:VOC family protein n=1 Tax=Fodinicola feengrottensis TaxID=435914 RepID=UPI00244263E3|nr:VOC family protein [Fodinicola feengrottensis]